MRADRQAEYGVRKRFGDLGCSTCHREDAQARGPHLRGLFGSTVKLQDGSTVVADESYLRESILDPRAKQVAGYEPIMPTYASQLGEEGVLELIAYIKTRTQSGGAPAGAPATPASASAPAADAGTAPHPAPTDGGAP